MKSRILFDKDTLIMLKQPDGYTEPCIAFSMQYNAACRIVNPLIAKFNEENNVVKLGVEEYEKRYFELFLNCFNVVPLPLGIYQLISYDGEDMEYEQRA